MTVPIDKNPNRMLVTQWVTCNVMRLSGITCVFLLTYYPHHPPPSPPPAPPPAPTPAPVPENQGDNDKQWWISVEDGGYFTMGPVIDGINLIICIFCFSISGNCHCSYWKKLLPFYCYAIGDLFLSIYLAYRVISSHIFILPFLGRVNKLVCISSVIYSLSFKSYHLLLTCNIMGKDIMGQKRKGTNNNHLLLLPPPSPPPSPPPPSPPPPSPPPSSSEII